MLAAAKESGEALGEWVFPARHGSQPFMVDVNEGLASACEKGEVGLRLTAHDLRRTFIGVARVVLADGLAVARLVGHAKSSAEDWGLVTAKYVPEVLAAARADAQAVVETMLELGGQWPLREETEALFERKGRALSEHVWRM